MEYCYTAWKQYQEDQIHFQEKGQASRYVTNRYHCTSSVTSILDHLQWETL
ncbi:hypothetical protein DPMN_100218 [Dreissena polymorpha]|uniref:Uncharacterized protein n=1 Tax=Dreissena polymorpha TaxID=45954 RepID=A0A9D4LHT5_DREPO|nr:hypothetical protein DPMN_100212 [Dreissena polymorpha]KAH3857607.1 hypothetical protein DPMN_100218 [Dreissena polymorpha]